MPQVETLVHHTIGNVIEHFDLHELQRCDRAGSTMFPANFSSGTSESECTCFLFIIVVVVVAVFPRAAAILVAKHFIRYAGVSILCLCVVLCILNFSCFTIQPFTSSLQNRKCVRGFCPARTGTVNRSEKEIQGVKIDAWTQKQNTTLIYLLKFTR